MDEETMVCVHGGILKNKTNLKGNEILILATRWMKLVNIY